MEDKGNTAVSESRKTHSLRRGAGTPVAVVAALLLNGCGAANFLPWSNSEGGMVEAPSSPAYVFNLPKPAVQTAAAKNFPFRAEGLKLPPPRLEVNHEVRRELTNYLRNNAHCIRDGLARQERLFPVLAKIFQDEGLPDELLNLALIESGFRPEASSPAGAVGLWQFMNGTAKVYGLEVSKRLDERKDPILSTMAAARHLKELYSKYNDWYLVLAAYNAGGGAVDRAVSSRKRSDYWTMVRTNRISRETARFVPKFIAASILQKLYFRYGSQVQLAQYLERHVITVSHSGSERRFAFRMDGASTTQG